jgi:hypothetical protein
VHGLRSEYQDRVNFVILDYDERDEFDLAGKMKVARHPAYAVVPPSSPPHEAVLQRFGPQPGEQLRALLDEVVARFSVEPGS